MTESTLPEMAEAVMAAAGKAGLTIVTAESCTAGALASLLAATPGAGSVLHGGFVSYSKDFKTRCLGVPAGLIAEQTAVSGDVAIAMARCALQRSPGADIAVAITGVLGPEPDEDGNPVGLVHVAAARGEKIASARTSGEGEPAIILHESLQCALELIGHLIAADDAMTPAPKRA